MNYFKYSLFFVIAILYSMQSLKASFSFNTFEEFDTYCVQHLPTLQACSSIENKVSFAAAFFNAQDFQTFRACNACEFELALDRFFAKLDASSLANQDAWIENNDLQNKFVDAQSMQYAPYAQKVVVGDSDIIALRGDMHGDIHSLLNFIRQLQTKGFTSPTNGFQIIDPKLKIIFLGDYVDRGIYGVEVIYAILRLKIENPEQVILVRGNHEDISICSRFGFKNELVSKFAESSQHDLNRIFAKLQKFYELLPVVVYVGCQEDEHSYNFVQCCHGGIEIGYNPQKLLASNPYLQYQLLGELQQSTQCEQLKHFLPELYCKKSYARLHHLCKNHTPSALTSFGEPCNGFMWNDFQHDACDPLGVQYDRGIQYSKEITESVLLLASSATHKVRGIIRAHQHVLNNTDPLMRQMLNSHGVARLWSDSQGIRFNPWQGIVCTLLLSPDNSVALKLGGFEGFDFDTTLYITMAPQFTQWDMQIINNDIYDNLTQHDDYTDMSTLLMQSD